MPEPSDSDELISKLRRSIERLSDERTHAERLNNTLLGRLKAAEDEASQLRSLLLAQAVETSKANWVPIEGCWFSVSSIRSLYTEGSTVKIDGVTVSLSRDDYPRIASRLAQLKRRRDRAGKARGKSGTKPAAESPPEAEPGLEAENLELESLDTEANRNLEGTGPEITGPD